MKNIDLVKTVLDTLKNLSVRDIIVCAGARNIPLVMGLDWQVEHSNHEDTFHITSYFEERSAAFYALGKAKASGRPVAIITTSGTAVAELLPAVIEAFYQDIPLVLITADRPKSYRGSGAPQAIEQAHLFEKYVEVSLDWDVFETNFTFSVTGKKPIHLNICFDEPLLDGPYSAAQASEVSISKLLTEYPAPKDLSCVNPLVIISELKQSERQLVADFIQRHQVFFYPEFLSGLMNLPELKKFQLNNLEGFSDIQSQYNFQSVIRIGGIPTLRLWRDLENKYKELPVINFSDRLFSGLARSSVHSSLAQLENLKVLRHESTEFIYQRNIVLQDLKQKALLKNENSEPAFVQKLSQVIKQDPLYIGNSLPIREWDLFSSTSQNDQLVFAHRGANGIDGQISSYLGWSAQFPVSWCLVGDLTALYDLASLGLIQHDQNHQKRIVIMNNSGGKIFNRLFGDKKYLNAQSVDFSGWAQLWGWNYIRITQSKDFAQLEKTLPKYLLIELSPDNIQSDQFWIEWDLVCKR